MRLCANENIPGDCVLRLRQGGLPITEHQAGVTNTPGLTASKSATGTVQLTVSGQTNLRYVFETSTNLAQWTKIAVRTNLTSTVDFAPAASSVPAKFYRVLVP